MKDYVAVIIWAIATVLLATTLTIGYSKSHKADMLVEYHCYLNIDLKDGYYTGTSRLSFTRGELEDLTPGNTVKGFVVSRRYMGNSSADFYIDEADNPTLDASKMSCFIS